MRRGNARVRVSPALGSPQLCAAARSAQPARWGWDVDAGHYTAVEVQDRLFGNLRLCYAGHFPLARTAEARTAETHNLELRNSGASGWPAGVVSWQGAIHDLGGLESGRSVMLQAGYGRPPANAGEQTAMARTPFGAVSVLWPMDLGAVEHLPTDSAGWLAMHVVLPRGESS
jgi:hypothetical protein